MAHVDLEELRGGVYFETATHDQRYTWAPVEPDDTIAPVTAEGEWADGFRRFRIVDCSHREVDRDGDRCSHCGQVNPYEPPKMTAARKARARRKK